MQNSIPKLNLKEKKALKTYKAILFKNLPNQIAKIILFGSKARGDYHRESDLDLLIITNWFKKNKDGWKKIIAGTTDILLEFKDVLISPKVKTKKEFNNSISPLMQNINQEGIKLWDQKQKNNLLDCW